MEPYTKEETVRKLTNEKKKKNFEERNKRGRKTRRDSKWGQVNKQRGRETESLQ